MPDELTPGATPTPQEPPAPPKVETAEELKARLAEVEKHAANKAEEAERLHKKVEKFEQEEEARRKAALTETERLQQERDEALKSAAELKTKQAQRDAAEKTGLPAAFADRIKGATPEEMEADAKLLLEAMPKGTVRKPPPPPSSPAEASPSKMTDAQKDEFLYGRRN